MGGLGQGQKENSLGASVTEKDEDWEELRGRETAELWWTLTCHLLIDPLNSRQPQKRTAGRCEKGGNPMGLSPGEG